VTNLQMLDTVWLMLALSTLDFRHHAMDFLSCRQLLW